MTTSHLNLKWTVSDVDRILEMARLGLTSEMIAHQFGWPTAAEIERVCADAGQFVRTKKAAGK